MENRLIIVVDASTIFSSAFPDKPRARQMDYLLTKNDIDLIAPEYALDELNDNWKYVKKVQFDKIKTMTGKDRSIRKKYLNSLIERYDLIRSSIIDFKPFQEYKIFEKRLVSDNELKRNYRKTENKDIPYLALALTYGTYLWAFNAKHFEDYDMFLTKRKLRELLIERYGRDDVKGVFFMNLEDKISLFQFHNSYKCFNLNSDTEFTCEKEWD